MSKSSSIPLHEQLQGIAGNVPKASTPAPGAMDAKPDTALNENGEVTQTTPVGVVQIKATEAQQTRYIEAVIQEKEAVAQKLLADVSLAQANVKLANANAKGAWVVIGLGVVSGVVAGLGVWATVRSGKREET